MCLRRILLHEFTRKYVLLIGLAYGTNFNYVVSIWENVKPINVIIKILF